MNAINRDCHTPLLTAVNSNHHKVVKLLLNNGAEKYCTDSHLRTCLHLACLRNNPKMVSFLIKNGCRSQIHMRDYKDMTCLHYAVLTDNTKVYIFFVFFYSTTLVLPLQLILCLSLLRPHFSPLLPPVSLLPLLSNSSNQFFPLQLLLHPLLVPL